mgnify:FL=1
MQTDQTTPSEQLQEDVTPSTSQPEENPTSLQPKPKNRKPLVITLIVVAIILIAGGGYFIYHSTQTDEEYTAYSILENNDNPQDYEDYLANFPNGEHADEVRERLAQLQAMLQEWNNIALSDNVEDFRTSKSRYSDPQYTRLCDIKIDSLDWISAQRTGTAEAYQLYLDQHPDGQYSSEASIAQGRLRDCEISSADRDQIMRIVSEFFKGFEMRDETLITSNITSSMTTFLHSTNVTKAEVMNTINSMFNEHIQGCSFVVNRDINVQRTNPSDPNSGFTATFTVDQHIQRDNEGKTFGSYNCTATLTPQYLISSLTMSETSANR